ncbi:hypothetical protein [Methylobacterium sp. E-045]|uniref:hypothetical protein n=1 Tax=Methylobacterium sp. E-045 TaxID=2836575 RepID=UPI001FB906D3|nr:hypothetical protein [Methylobacterium sp. E-045]MCJ2128496.1 hypothetical protein [Methylobacterium sp. E-045]
MAQLRKDIGTSFANARRKVEAYASASEDLSGELRRWTDYALRFVEPDPTIRNLHRVVLESADDLTGLMAAQPRPRDSSIATAKAHLTKAFDDLEEAILKHGILTPGGEKVGLGIAGRPI